MLRALLQRNYNLAFAGRKISGPAITAMEAVNKYMDQIKAITSGNKGISAIDIDLMLEHTRRLYESILQLREEQQLSLATPVVPPIQLPEEAPVITAEVETETPLPEIAPEPEPVMPPAIIQEPAPETTAATDTVEEALTPRSIPSSTTAAEDYSRKLTSFNVSGKDIRMYIGINDKYNFISELFGSNNEAYEQILDEINTFETQEDALFFLNNSGVTTLYHWQEDSFSVRIFHNVLNQFFSAR